MNLDKAIKLYVEKRTQIEKIEAEMKLRTAQVKLEMQDLESWITMKAAAEGLKTIPTPFGTAYWSVHNSASVAARDVFFDFVKENQAWDLLEARASRTAVKSFVDGHGEPPPGVNFSAVRVFNIRANKGGE